MVRTNRLSTGRRVGAALLLAAAATLAMLPRGVTAQEVPQANTGPQFGAWAPGHAAPGGAQQVEPPLAAYPGGPGLGAAAPAPAPAPGPGVGAPPPNWGGCNHNLSGAWAASGQETSPAYFAYDGNVSVVQYGNWVQATETQGWGQTQYYGQCMGDSVRFDVYANGRFIGYQNGVVQAGGRWGWPRINFNWATWAPGYAVGTEHWRRGSS